MAFKLRSMPAESQRQISSKRTNKLRAENAHLQQTRGYSTAQSPVRSLPHQDSSNQSIAVQSGELHANFSLGFQPLTPPFSPVAWSFIDGTGQMVVYDDIFSMQIFRQSSGCCFGANSLVTCWLQARVLIQYISFMIS